MVSNQDDRNSTDPTKRAVSARGDQCAAAEDIADAARAGSDAARDLAVCHRRAAYPSTADAAERLADAFASIAAASDRLADTFRDISAADRRQLGHAYVHDLLGPAVDYRGHRLGPDDVRSAGWRPVADPSLDLLAGGPHLHVDDLDAAGLDADPALYHSAADCLRPTPRSPDFTNPAFDHGERGYDYPRHATDGPDPDEGYDVKHSDEVDDCPACGTSAPGARRQAERERYTRGDADDQSPAPTPSVEPAPGTQPDDDDKARRRAEWIAKVSGSWLDPANVAEQCACGDPTDPEWNHAPNGCDYPRTADVTGEEIRRRVLDAWRRAGIYQPTDE